jgi:hypothetical protein
MHEPQLGRVMADEDGGEGGTESTSVGVEGRGNACPQLGAACNSLKLPWRSPARCRRRSSRPGRETSVSVEAVAPYVSQS